MPVADAPISEVSARKLAANRRNARHSTGPRTPDGKATSSQNAVTHGLCLDDHRVLPSESQEDHDQLRNHFVNALCPADPVEESIIERMIASRWKLRRLRDFEANLFQSQSRGMVNAIEDDYHRKVLNTYKIKNAEKEVLYKESDARRETDWLKVPPGGLLLVNDTDWERLARHEKRLEDQFYKAERELRLWRKEKRADSSARGLAQPSDDDEFPVSQNEPTTNQVNATQATTEACNTPPSDPPPQPPQEVGGKLPINPIQPIALNIPESG